MRIDRSQLDGVARGINNGTKVVQDKPTLVVEDSTAVAKLSSDRCSRDIQYRECSLNKSD
jgi:hypothetical protein